MSTPITWGDIKTLVLANLGRQGDSETIALLPLWAKLFQQKVERDRNYWFLKATFERELVSTKQIYSLPGEFKDDLLVYLKNTDPKGFKELYPITDHDVVRQYGPVVDETDKEEPEHYIIADQSITLWPHPNKAYTLRLIGWRNIDTPDVVSSDDFSNTWVSDYADLYTQELTAMGFGKLQEAQDSNIWEIKADKTLMTLRSQHVARELPGEATLTPKSGQYDATIGTRKGPKGYF